jgi:hypothetical protein
MQENIFRIVDSIFKWILKQDILLKKPDEFEHISLKSIFIIFYRILINYFF